MKNTSTKTFTSIDDVLLANTKLTHTQKNLISYILRWQSNGKVCFESNQTLANKFGLKVSGIRSLIKKLNKYEFFTSIKSNKTGTASTHELRINEEKLQAFLNSSIETKSNEISVLTPEPSASCSEAASVPEVKPTPSEEESIDEVEGLFITEDEQSENETSDYLTPLLKPKKEQIIEIKIDLPTPDYKCKPMDYIKSLEGYQQSNTKMYYEIASAPKAYHRTLTQMVNQNRIKDDELIRFINKTKAQVALIK